MNSATHYRLLPITHVSPPSVFQAFFQIEQHFKHCSIENIVQILIEKNHANYK